MNSMGKKKALADYRLVYGLLWSTYGQSWKVRASYLTLMLSRVCKLIMLPIMVSRIVYHLSRYDFAAAVKFSFMYAIFSALLGLLNPATKFLSLRDENRIYASAVKDYFAKLLSTDMKFFNDNMAGYLTTSVRQFSDNTLNLERSLRDKYINAVMAIVMPVGVIVYYDIPLGLATAILAGVQIVYLFWASNALSSLRSESREQYKLGSGFISDTISNILAVRSTAQEDSKSEDLKVKLQRETKLFTTRYIKQAKLALIREGITVVFFLLTFLLTVSRMKSGAIGVAEAVLMAAYSLSIMTAIYELSDKVEEHDDYVDKILPALEVYSYKSTVTDPAEPATVGRIKGDINFRDVTFAYEPGAAKVFDKFNLKIKRGEKVGVVGLSGAGKSTLTKLLLRFEDVQEGRVLIDGFDVRSLRQKDLRSQVAYVAQEPLLFHDTILNNILIGQPDASVDKVKKAAKAAHAAEFIDVLPLGYQSVVGERGVKLSGGQKQRVAIARAVLQNTPIVVFDEATSALDSESEQIIKDSFVEIFKGKTAIVVAHRLSTLSHMDRIIVVDKGRIIEEGSHEALLTKNGLYAKLWNRQKLHKEY